MSYYKPTDEQSLGLDLDGNRLHAAFLAVEKGKIRVKNCITTIVNNEEADVNPLYMNKEGQNLRALMGKNLTVTAIPSSDLLVRRLRLKLMREKL